MLLTLWTILLFIITISILVTVHEFGHYWVARRCGIKVERFSIGFGPKLYSYTTVSGTEFAISAIPLGGYVKMLDSRVDELSDDDKKFAFDHKSIAKRAAVVCAGPVANFILSFLVYWVVFQVGVMTYPAKIAQILPGSIASSVNIPAGSELKSIAGIKVSDWQDVQLALVSEIGEKTLAIEYLPVGEDVSVTTQLDITDWRVDFDTENPITALGWQAQRPQILPILSEVISHSAADKAGLQAGDEIVSYNGTVLAHWDDLVSLIKLGDPIELNVKRQSELLSLRLAPELKEMADPATGQTVTQGFAGFIPSSDVVVKQYGVISAVGKAFEQTGFMIKTVMRSFYQLLTGTFSLKNLSGPVSIAQSAEQSARFGLVPYLNFLAFISISLGVINLVPLPMLDGGHLLFLAIEKIKGSPLAERTQAIFYRIGFMVLIMLMGIALFNDFLRL